MKNDWTTVPGSPGRHASLPVASTRHRRPGALLWSGGALSQVLGIGATGSHGMLGLDHSAGKRLEQSDVASDVCGDDVRPFVLGWGHCTVVVRSSRLRSR